MLQALQYITSSDPNLLFAALLVPTGARPIMIAKVAEYKTSLNNSQQHQSFWACQYKFAKRGTMLTVSLPYWLLKERYPSCANVDRVMVSTIETSRVNKGKNPDYGLTDVAGHSGEACTGCAGASRALESCFYWRGEPKRSLNGYASWMLLGTPALRTRSSLTAAQPDHLASPSAIAV